MSEVLSQESSIAVREAQAKQQVDNLTMISRICSNAINLLTGNDVTIPIAYAKPVAEITDWLSGMHKGLRDEIERLRPSLSAEDQKAVPTVVEAVKTVEQLSEAKQDA